MQKRIIFNWIFISLFCYSLQGQELSRGASLPEIISYQTINFPSPVFRLSDYKGKPLIIDFWSFRCSSCLNRFPETELLQKKFEGKLQIILVNLESKAVTDSLFEKFKNLRTKIRKPNLRMVTGDTIFHKLFPLKGLPLIIWVDANGKFRYRTSDRMNEEQLTAFINGQTPPDLIEIDPKADFIIRKPLFEQPNKEYVKDISYYSYIAHYLDGSDIGNSNRQFQNEGKVVRLSRNIGTISTLLMTAFGEDDGKYVFRNGVNVLLAVDNISKYIRPEENKNKVPFAEIVKWNANYRFRYDCAVPPEKKDKLYEFMRQDLCRYFDLDVKVEKRMVKCLALVRTSNDLKIKERGLSKSPAYLVQNGSERIDSIYYVNMPMKDFVRQLQVYHYSLGIQYPIVNQTNYDGKIDMAMPYMDDGNTTLQYWKEQLARYDLALVEKECLTDVLVIKEK